MRSKEAESLSQGITNALVGKVQGKKAGVTNFDRLDIFSLCDIDMVNLHFIIFLKYSTLCKVIRRRKNHYILSLKAFLFLSIMAIHPLIFIYRILIVFYFLFFIRASEFPWRFS